MAWLSRESGRSSWQIGWTVGTKRQSIRLGSMTKRAAESVRSRIEELIDNRRAGLPLPPGLGEWVDAIDDDLRDRLVRGGLVVPRRRRSLGDLVDAYVESRPKISAATKVRDRQVTGLLVEKFGRDCPLDSIGRRDAEAWRRWLGTQNRRDSNRDELADNTIRRRTGVARQVFAVAIRWGWLTTNPFEGLSANVRENPERQEFVPWSSILAAIEACPNQEWRTMLAFVRLTGVRVPSELVALTWGDIDFAAKRLTIRSPKTAHHGADKASRVVPLFPELLPYLEDLASLAEPGVTTPLSDPVFPCCRSGAINLRQRFTKILERAGVTAWPKLFHQLRASRQTELLASFPAADVCRWLGNSPAIAARHYAMPTTESFERAVESASVNGSAGGAAGGATARSGGAAGGLAAPHDAVRPTQERANTLKKQQEMRLPAMVLSGPETGEGVGGTGLEPVTSAV
ncbi:MAG TPA: hypothetical protein DCQ98_19290 [Planctomycetaceae bacterium]|nr:hypothetical protein [Planctomycetaceae bacterium]